MTNYYKNKFFSILGDSVSTLEGYSEPEFAAFYDTAHKLAADVLTPLDTWWGQVIDRLGGELLVNNSFSGSTVCRHSSHEIPSYACSDERTSALGRSGVMPDVIMVYMGTNDWGCGTKIRSEKGCKGAENPLVSFSTAYGSMLEKLRKNYPHAEIWCMSLAVSRCSAMEDFNFPYCYGGRHISEYCDAIQTCAEKHGALFFDLYHCMEAYDTLDGFHPNASGMKWIAEAVLSELENGSCDE